MEPTLINYVKALLVCITDLFTIDPIADIYILKYISFPLSLKGFPQAIEEYISVTQKNIRKKS